MGNGFDQCKGVLESSFVNEGRKGQIGDGESPESTHQRISDGDSVVRRVPTGNAMQSKVVQGSQLMAPKRIYR